MIVTLIRGGGEIHFAYIVSENDVLFTPLQRSPSSINIADSIVEAICEKEKLDCRKTTFYDVQTSIGYPHRLKAGYFNVDRLVIDFEKNRPHVTAWREALPETLYSEELEKSNTKLSQRMRHFKELIVEEGVNWQPVEAVEDQVFRAWANDWVRTTWPGSRRN